VRAKGGKEGEGHRHTPLRRIVGGVPGVTGSRTGCCRQPLNRIASTMAATAIPKPRVLGSSIGTRKVQVFVIDGGNAGYPFFYRRGK
jgi:hypothetical protein